MAIFREEHGNELFKTKRYVYTLSNDNMQVKIMNYGGVILSIVVPDKDGIMEDVVLGYDNFDSYKKTDAFPGAIVGRVANRISNAKFNINGKAYKLVKNNGENHIHGGINNFSKVFWNSKIATDNEGEYLELSYLSRDGEENYPGNLDVVVEYKLTNKNELIIRYKATTDKDTIINLTNHSYFNLAGQGKGNILNQKVKIYSDEFAIVDKEGMVTGEIRNVKGTPMDFSDFKEIGVGINSDYYQIKCRKGYDHNYVIKGNMDEIKLVAEAIDEKSGRKLQVFSTMPGLQFYTGNFLNSEEVGKGKIHYDEYYGFCFETQFFPDAINKSNFENPILKPGEVYNHTTIYKFSTI